MDTLNQAIARLQASASVLTAKVDALKANQVDQPAIDAAVININAVSDLLDSK